MDQKQAHAEYQADVDRLYREAQERSVARAREYWSKPPPVLTEEQQRARARSRAEFARFAGCTVQQVYWHGPDQCWSIR